jgi:transcriptional regulator of arginine metabolism
MKNKRHDAILEIIRIKDISTQEELQKELSARGFEVTQATVSRDIRRLHLAKRQIPQGKSIYVIPSRNSTENTQDKERFLRVLQDSVISVVDAQNLIVIKTGAGMAMAAAAVIDSAPDERVLGSIAGDDTIIVVLKTVGDAIDVCRKLKHDLRLQ